MEHLKKFENYEHRGIKYDKKWKMPRNKIREDIEADVREMALEVTDLGYSISLGGFTFNQIKWEYSNKAFIWVGGKSKSKFSYEEISYFIDRLKVYFDDIDFNTAEYFLSEQNKESLNQMYLYFWPKNELE